MTASLGPWRLIYRGTGGELLGIVFVNFLLTLVTLGVYSFWGRTRLRRYITSHLELEGQQFDYHGTGLELLVGFAKALGLFAVVVAGSVVLRFTAGEELGAALAALLTVGVLLALMPMIVTGARRYRMSRTSYRGIRFSFRGTVRECARVYYKGLALTVLTLGVYYPFFVNDLMDFLIRHTWYGSLKLDYDGRGREVWPVFLLALVLAPFTLGMSLFAWNAALERHIAQSTSILGVRFRSMVTWPDLLALAVTNILLTVCTLGVGWSWAQTRVLRYHAGCLTTEGPLNIAYAVEQARDASATAEGLDLLFEAEAGFFDLAF